MESLSMSDGNGRLLFRWENPTELELKLGELDLLEVMDISAITVRLTPATYPEVTIELVAPSLELELEDPDIYVSREETSSKDELIEERAPRREPWGDWPPHIYRRGET